MSNPSIDLSGKVAIISGGTSGIGEAICRAFAAAGATTVIAGRRYEKAKLLETHIKQDGGKALAIKCDLANRSDIENLVQVTIATFGKVEILVNSAAHFSAYKFEDLPFEEWQTSVNVNITGTYYLTRLCVLDMLKRGKGNVIIIGSSATINGSGGGIHYAMTKAALLGMLKSMTYELLPRGIRTNLITPAVIDTEMLRARYVDDPTYKERYTKQIPLGRMGQPQDIANIALFLASDLSEYICGQEIVADGGRCLYRRFQ